ncbi:DUF268 domain-containing protein [Geomobilimonas luticola]|uniref:DUF268 domain-containing protein n=1 Tax=Geomobilimonas luticola TaxID=1114878 RepID=A0ABS5SER8_9BACT|nr:DUF268 domain-containing protein [Geomobilimonas luticola]MBT0653116.1 DUF268 domain-containing protein [Geomobilimonas luticola]
MRQLLRRIYSLSLTFGFNHRKTIQALKGLLPYYLDLRTLKRQETFAKIKFAFGKSYLCLEDRLQQSGTIKGHYFHQDLLVARRIYLDNPGTHVDVGSRIDGFVAHVASFRLIEVLDIRPLSNSIPNIRFMQADLMAPVDKNLEDYADSVSCLHALEHFGLGRYGDPVNYDGYLLGLNNLLLILKKGGKLYLSVPIGPQRIEFNAQRVFSVSFLLKYFSGKCHIKQFSFVDDQGNLHENVPITVNEINSNFNCIFGCGIFELEKL